VAVSLVGVSVFSFSTRSLSYAIHLVDIIVLDLLGGVGMEQSEELTLGTEQRQMGV
jgi:hypothetical protein